MFEKFALKWNDFQSNLCDSTSTLRNDTDFADMKLACEDDQDIACHKVILSLSSSVFKEILKKLKNPKPVIYLKGTEKKYCQAAIQIWCKYLKSPQLSTGFQGQPSSSAKEPRTAESCWQGWW